MKLVGTIETVMLMQRDRHRDGQTWTDGQTDTARRHRPRLCIASRGKNLKRRFISDIQISYTGYLKLLFQTLKINT